MPDLLLLSVARNVCTFLLVTLLHEASALEQSSRPRSTRCFFNSSLRLCSIARLGVALFEL